MRLNVRPVLACFTLPVIGLLTVAAAGCGDKGQGPSGSAVAVTGASPATAPSGFQTRVNIIGRNFRPGAQVSFGQKAAQVVTVDHSVITVLTPPVTTGAADVTVTNPDGRRATLSNGFTFLERADFRLDPPESWPLDYVMLRGSGFVAGTRVLVDGLPVAGTVRADGIGISLPWHAPGAVDVQVIDPLGQSTLLKGAFTFLGATLTSSAAVVDPGESVVLTWAGPFDSDFPPYHTIALYRLGDPGKPAVWREFLSGKGSMPVTFPTTPGDYEFRFLMYDRHVLATSSVIVVRP